MEENSQAMVSELNKKLESLNKKIKKAEEENTKLKSKIEELETRLKYFGDTETKDETVSRRSKSSNNKLWSAKGKNIQVNHLSNNGYLSSTSQNYSPNMKILNPNLNLKYLNSLYLNKNKGHTINLNKSANLSKKIGLNLNLTNNSHSKSNFPKRKYKPQSIQVEESKDDFNKRSHSFNMSSLNSPGLFKNKSMPYLFGNIKGNETSKNTTSNNNTNEYHRERISLNPGNIIPKPLKLSPNNGYLSKSLLFNRSSTPFNLHHNRPNILKNSNTIVNGCLSSKNSVQTKKITINNNYEEETLVINNLQKRRMFKSNKIIKNK